MVSDFLTILVQKSNGNVENSGPNINASKSFTLQENIYYALEEKILTSVLFNFSLFKLKESYISPGGAQD